MKKMFILGAVMLTAMILALVSCEKDEASVDATTKRFSKSFYKPPKTDDMNAYLMDFKLKMQLRGNDDTMDLDEAAWHLSSVANYDFGDVVDDYARFHYDTLRYNINVEDGKVRVSDLNALYTIAVSDIESTFENLDLDNKHIRFIGADISGSGAVVMSILVTYGWTDHQWYFSDPFTLYETLSQYYSEDSIYYINTTFPRELKRVLDIISGHLTDYSNHFYYTIDRSVSCMYFNYTDPYGSDFYNNSRIFAKVNPGSSVTLDDMFYLTDSYLGFGFDLLEDDEVIIDWIVSELQFNPNHGFSVTYHVPTVRIGTPHPYEPNPGGSNN